MADSNDSGSESAAIPDSSRYRARQQISRKDREADAEVAATNEVGRAYVILALLVRDVDPRSGDLR
jgi:hypothetical protein